MAAAAPRSVPLATSAAKAAERVSPAPEKTAPRSARTSRCTARLAAWPARCQCIARATGFRRPGCRRNAHFRCRLGDIARARAAGRTPVGQQPAPQCAVVSYQHGRLRQHELAEGVEVQVDLPFVPPRKVGHVGDQRHVGVVGGDLGDGTDGLGTADETDLEDLNRKRLPGSVRACSVISLVVEGEMVEYLCGVAGISAGDNRQARGRRPRRSPCTSAASPPAPLGSLALNTMTQAGLASLILGNG